MPTDRIWKSTRVPLFTLILPTCGGTLSTMKVAEGPAALLVLDKASVATPLAMVMPRVPVPVIPLMVTTGLLLVPLVTLMVPFAVPVLFRVTLILARLTVVAPVTVIGKSTGPMLVMLTLGAPIETIGPDLIIV